MPDTTSVPALGAAGRPRSEGCLQPRGRTGRHPQRRRHPGPVRAVRRRDDRGRGAGSHDYQPDSPSGKAVLTKAKAAGVRTIDYDRFTFNGDADYYVSNDGIANADIGVLKRNGLNGQVPVTGQDTTVQGLQHILAGDQRMTVCKDIEPEAERAPGTRRHALQRGRPSGRRPGEEPPSRAPIHHSSSSRRTRSPRPPSGRSPMPVSSPGPTSVARRTPGCARKPESEAKGLARRHGGRHN